MIWYFLGGLALVVIGIIAGVIYGSRTVGKGFEESESERERFKHL